MNKKLELINSLLMLGEQCKRVADLLDTNILNEIKSDTILSVSPDMSQSLDILQFELWPKASDVTNTHWKNIAVHQAQDISQDFSNCKIIEFSKGPSTPIGHIYHNSKVDLICDTHKFGTDAIPDNVRIVKAHEMDNEYDVGIIYESLEFDSHPAQTLLSIRDKIKPNGKIFLRFRPWSSQDGGFQSRHFNKAYAHLLMDLESNVINKVVRPLVTYNTMLAAASLKILSRRIHSTMPDEFITNNDHYMNTLISRTWGIMDRDSAVKIMMTNNVDFLVSL